MEEIEKSLDESKAVLLLVSQSFLASEFINKVELLKILADKKVFWVPLSSSTVFETHKQITAYQSLLKNPQTSLEEPAEAECKKQMVQITKE